MSLLQTLLDTIALVLYPGAAACLLVAVAAVGGFRRFPEAESLRALAGLAPALVLAGFAAAQSEAPFNPLPAGDRNLLAGVVATVAAAWLAGSRVRPRRELLLQVVWAAAVLAPALEPQVLRPQAIGALAVPALAAVKLASVVAAVLAAPALLEGTETGRPSPVILPSALLVASVAVPPPDDVYRVALFVAAAAAAAAGSWLAGRAAVRGFAARAAPVLALVALLATGLADLTR